MLMGADRINVVEGVIDDVANGVVPNIPVEMGIRSAWRHNRSELLRRLGTAAVIGALAVSYRRAWRAAGCQDAKLEPWALPALSDQLHRP